MTRPSPITYLFGNLVSLIAILIAALWIGYQWLQGLANGWLALGLLLALVHAAKCERQLAAYGRWKREWERMNGQPPVRPLMANPWVRYPVGTAAWLIGAWMATRAGGAPGMEWAVALFWIGSMMGFGKMLMQAIKGTQRNIPQKEIAVKVCPSVPLRSVPVSVTYNELPEYCTSITS